MATRSAHRSIQHALTLVLLAHLAACGGGGGGGGNGGGGVPSPTLSSVGVSGDRASVEAGATLQLKATATFSNASTTDVTSQAAWTSSADQTASVSATGLVTAKAAGTARMTASFQGQSGAMDVTVTPPPLQARFAVRTNRPADSDVCRIRADKDLDCFFDGAASGPDATTWVWTWAQGVKQHGPTSTNVPTFEPSTGCSFFDSKAPQAGTGFVQMIVTLRVRDASGRESADLVNGNVRLFPQNNCGFGF